MIRIDGSYLEGGGQIVRGAVAFAALTGEPVTISDIRKKRSNPGLAAQHCAAVRAVAAVCDAACTGLFPGSTELVFSPERCTGRDIAIDVGTAGSIPLVLQAWLPVALAEGGSITVSGGTEVLHSPTIDYFDAVYAEALRRHGADIRVTIGQRGYYPRGGGQVTATVAPARLRPIAADDAAPGEALRIFSCSSNLPPHVTERQAEAAERSLAGAFPFVPTSTLDCRSGPSTGSSCTVACGLKGGIALGRRGYPAEEVGREAAGEFLAAYNGPGACDVHLADQLIIILAVAGGRITTAAPSDHTRTMCWLAAAFGSEVAVREQGGGAWEIAA
ncbi:MAG: RNA 3'-terminal phosphate cyclase [Methanomicrobiales archaeon]|nr:RNA 3'-terminal phosphate cyclase [Methanomicrobiales archaeon]